MNTSLSLKRWKSCKQQPLFPALLTRVHTCVPVRVCMFLSTGDIIRVREKKTCSCEQPNILLFLAVRLKKRVLLGLLEKQQGEGICTLQLYKTAPMF